MDTLNYIATKFELDLNQKSPITISKINRTIMAQTLSELGFRVGVEIGVAAGIHAETLCKNNPNLKLYGIDPWIHYPGYVDFLSNKLSQFHEEAKQRLAPYNCELIRKFSMDALNDFSDRSLDFVYIDGAHDFKSVADDICEWERKVKLDGIVFGHDYKRSNNPAVRTHVQDVVGAYTYALRVVPWFILGEMGHSDGMYKEGTRSWMWVKK
jgi:predicted O-methyltransferase YrrM